ncbi:hypothetical protein KFK09_000751 [Dendrobium nobile]|uniref:Tf2-1-like SH3-like domain-containing protein n=1 Tax=Dendrobium nobile TaxID=94219 RepID=A0A8T3C9H0_DENNO|nr:hypothetical protein KFK09_000751 [Dendrobium nobile]
MTRFTNGLTQTRIFSGRVRVRFRDVATFDTPTCDGLYSHISPRKLGLVSISKRINDNAYVVDLPPHIHTSSTFNVADIHAYQQPHELATINSSTVSPSMAGET